MRKLIQLRPSTAGVLLFLLAAGSIQSATTVWERSAWNGRVEQAVFSAGCGRVACRLADGRVLVRDLAQGGATLSFDTAPYAVTQVSISPDGGRVAWGDTSGNLHVWNPVDGLKSASAGAMALTGVALAPDGTVVAVAGNGVQVSLRSTSHLLSVYNRSINAEQIMALDAGGNGNMLLAGDHSGRIYKVNRLQNSTQSRSVSTIGWRGLRMLADDASLSACWNAEGRLWFLDAGLNTLAELDLGPVRITACLHDAASGRLLFGRADGTVQGVSLGNYQPDTAPLASLGSAVAGLGLDADGKLLALTGEGELYRLHAGASDLIEDPAFTGQAVRGAASAQAGKAAVLTDQGAWLLALQDGAGTRVVPAAAGIVLDVALLHGTSGPIPVQLVLDQAGISVQAAAPGALEPFAITDAIPDRMVAGNWSPALALMSGDGAVILLRESAGKLDELASLPADPARLWTGLSFVDGDRALLKWGKGAALLHWLDGGATDHFYSLASADIPEAVAFDTATMAVLHASDGKVYRVSHDGQPLLLYTAPAGGQVVALLAHPGRRELEIHGTDAVVKVGMDDGTVRDTVPNPDPLALAAPLADGPFRLRIAQGGLAGLTRDDADPLVLAWPALLPDAGGGMWSGYFGNISASRDGWIHQREFGWGYLYPAPAFSWYWFAGEGWLAGGPLFGRYLYSDAKANWLYTYVEAYPTDWIYDYAGAAWRRFGQ